MRPIRLKGTEKKPSKYRNKKTKFDGDIFDSGLEAARYAELKMLERVGEIADLKRQVPYDLVVNGIKICTYVADHVYKEKSPKWVPPGVIEWKPITEDVKGARTAVYLMKKKLMKAIYGIEIKEVTSVRR